jgi:hypothetical protein
MKQGKRRTMSICLTDIKEKAADKIVKASNGKLYLPIETYDYDKPDKYDHDFSVSVSRNKEEVERVKNGEKIDRIFIGNGRIWENTEPIVTQAPQEEVDDLPF